MAEFGLHIVIATGWSCKTAIEMGGGGDVFEETLRVLEVELC